METSPGSAASVVEMSLLQGSLQEERTHLAAYVKV